MFENKVLRKIFGHRKRKQQDDGTNYMMRSFIRCNLHQHYWGDETEDEIQRHVHSIHKELRNAYKF
jgi:hypothetical protein